MNLKEERNKELIRVYQETLRQLGDRVKDMPMTRLFRLVINHPTSRYYISYYSAKKYVKAMEGGFLPSKKCNRSEVVSFFNAYLREVSASNGAAYKNKLIERAVNSSAPSFFISVQTAMNIVFGRKG